MPLPPRPPLQNAPPPSDGAGRSLPPLHARLEALPAWRERHNAWRAWRAAAGVVSLVVLAGVGACADDPVRPAGPSLTAERPTLALASDTRAVQVSVAYLSACALTNAGDAACWGANDRGQAPPLVPGPFTQVSAGFNHVCALTSRGDAACWGANDFGQAPAVVPGPYSQVTATRRASCGLKMDGSLACWGQTGTGGLQIPASAPGPFTQVSGGDGHVCGLQADGAAACWGWFNDMDVPALVPGPFTHVTGGLYGMCGLRADGAAACWGEYYGQSGTPTVVLGPFTQIDEGAGHGCGVRPDQSVECWGDASNPAWWPVGQFVQVSAGWGSTCALATDGRVACWDNLGGPTAQPPAELAFLSGGTATGTDVAAAPVDAAPVPGAGSATLVFDNVTTAGTTTVSSSSTGAPPPLGFKVGNPPVYYELQTTATFSGAIAVCFTYDPAAYQNPANLRLFHDDGGGWADVTTSNDPVAGKICGSVTSLSPFVAAELRYDFTGFFAPVANPGTGTTPVVNTVKAGAAVPVKFALGGDLGLGVLAEGSPASVAYACGEEAEAAVEQTVAASASGLTYDATAGQYIYTWKTDKAWAGTCRKLTVTLKDGTAHDALFKLTR